MKANADQVAGYFFKMLWQNQCHICWGLLSKKSQEHFLKWTLDDMTRRHPEAVAVAKLGPSEIRLLFENNDRSVMQSFWKRFFYASNSDAIYRYGWRYEVVELQGKESLVRVVLDLPDGRKPTVDFKMINERGGWKLAYVESELPF